MQDQSGRALMTGGGAESKLRQGITSLIAGEGGTPVLADEILPISPASKGAASPSISAPITGRSKPAQR